MRVHITQAYIDAANEARNSNTPSRGSNHFMLSLGCPTALALSAAFGKPVFVDGLEYGFVYGKGRSVRLPDDVIHFINLWDARQPVSPMEFDV